MAEQSDPKIPPEALAPSGRSIDSLPEGAGGPAKDQGDGDMPTKEELPEVKNPIPPG